MVPINPGKTVCWIEVTGDPLQKCRGWCPQRKVVQAPELCVVPRQTTGGPQPRHVLEKGCIIYPKDRPANIYHKVDPLHHPIQLSFLLSANRWAACKDTATEGRSPQTHLKSIYIKSYIHKNQTTA